MSDDGAGEPLAILLVNISNNIWMISYMKFVYWVFIGIK